MLVKCVCSNCGHSYLADDEAGQLDCPRCGVGNEGYRNPSDIPDAPMGAEPGVYDGFQDDYGYEDEERFDPQAPPPLVVTGDRMLRGLAGGVVVALLVGLALGAALGALRSSVPGVVGIVLGFLIAAGCRYGFGGRAASRSKGRAMAIAFVAALIGFAGFFTGSWIVERYTGSRAEQTREDLNIGLRNLRRQRAATGDAGRSILLDQRIAEAERIRALSDARIEDYLWIQEAQVNQGLCAFTKLRATQGPLVQLGPDMDPIEVPETAMLAILAVEIAIAAFLAVRSAS